MINLTPLIKFLKIVSLLGLIVTVCMMAAVTYHKLEAYYPNQVRKNKIMFIAGAIILSIILFFIAQKFINRA